MPNGNQQGPRGEGPGSGRRAGYCSGAGQPGWMSGAPAQQGGGNPAGSGGKGRGGRGQGGHGRRGGFKATGLSGWQRAAAGLMAWGSGQKPNAPAKPDANPVPEPALDQLKQQAREMEMALSQMRQRIDEMAAQPAEK